jgi:hypothetical protein
MSERNVIIEFLDGTSMKAPPETWDGLVDCYNKGGKVLGILGDKLDTLVPLAAIKRVYRSNV